MRFLVSMNGTEVGQLVLPDPRLVVDPIEEQCECAVASIIDADCPEHGYLIEWENDYEDQSE